MALRLTRPTKPKSNYTRDEHVKFWDQGRHLRQRATWDTYRTGTFLSPVSSSLSHRSCSSSAFETRSRAVQASLNLLFSWGRPPTPDHPASTCKFWAYRSGAPHLVLSVLSPSASAARAAPEFDTAPKSVRLSHEIKSNFLFISYMPSQSQVMGGGGKNPVRKMGMPPVSCPRAYFTPSSAHGDLVAQLRFVLRLSTI